MSRVENRGSNGADAVAPAMQAEAAGHIGGVDSERLKRDIERIRKHRQERKDIGASERDIFKLLKGDGYNSIALRKLLAFEDMKDRKQIGDDMDTYRVALGWAVDAVRSGELSARQAARAANIGKSSVYKALAVHEVSTVVEMTADDLGARQLCENREGIGHNSKRVCVSPCAATWQQITSARDAFEAEREAVKEAERNRRRAEREALAAKNAVIDADPLDIPPFLRRVA